ncbi:unnamed protein product [Symbiodinium sp. KB8]|nr:unnamed protein product [Symbiodinium sp. KB8]
MAAAQSSGVRDVLRSALAFDDYNGLLEAIHFINQVDVKAVIQKNRFSSPARGWRDVLFLEFSSGIAARCLKLNQLCWCNSPFSSAHPFRILREGFKDCSVLAHCFPSLGCRIWSAMCV